MTRTLRPCGPHAVLVEFDDVAELRRAAAAWRAEPPAGVLDVVPAARTVLLDARPGTDLAALARAAQAPLPDATVAAAGSGAVELVVDYDGPDLAEVAALTGRTVDDVVATHTGTPWTVAFCGFAPGFGYLTAAGDPLTVPRRATPRTRVPAGAVGLAGPYTGVYPSASPGGWQLLGRTDAVLWDVDRDPPALLVPGTTVRFRAR